MPAPNIAAAAFTYILRYISFFAYFSTNWGLRAQSLSAQDVPLASNQDKGVNIHQEFP